MPAGTFRSVSEYRRPWAAVLSTRRRKRHLLNLEFVRRHAADQPKNSPFCCRAKVPCASVPVVFPAANHQYEGGDTSTKVTVYRTASSLMSSPPVPRREH